MLQTLNNKDTNHNFIDYVKNKRYQNPLQVRYIIAITNNCL